MWSNRSRCFVRVWHHPGRDEKTNNRPLWLVTYRFALEKYYPFTDYHLLHYDGQSRARVRSVCLVNGRLQIVLKNDPLVKVGRHITLVSAEVKKLQGGVLVLTVTLACSPFPEDNNQPVLEFRGRLHPWLETVRLPSDYKSAIGDRLLTARFSQRASDYIGDYDSDFDD